LTRKRARYRDIEYRILALRRTDSTQLCPIITINPFARGKTLFELIEYEELGSRATGNLTQIIH